MCAWTVAPDHGQKQIYAFMGFLWLLRKGDVLEFNRLRSAQGVRGRVVFVTTPAWRVGAEGFGDVFVSGRAFRWRR